MEHDTNHQVDGFIRRLKLVLVVCGVVLVVPLVMLLFYLDRRIDTFENELRYRAPQSEAGSNAVLDSLTWEPVQGQTVYVPAYSHVYHQDGKPQLLTVTLSVRNTDPNHDIVISSVRYYDTRGHEVRSYLKNTLPLAPLASTEFLVERDDASGGSGANFLVTWVAGEPVTPPVIEAVMIDASGTQGISFVRPGTVVNETLPVLDTGVQESQGGSDEP